MQKSRPFECPACGHDRILKRPHELFTETGQLRVRAAKFVCGLCSYQWSTPMRGIRADEWELA